MIPIICSSLDLFCLLNLGIYRMYKQKWRKLSRWDKFRNYFFMGIMIICSCDVIRAAVLYTYPYVNNLCRPWVCIIFFSSIRQNLKSVLFDFKDSLIILSCIFLYICYFAAIGFFILEGTFQGFSDFDTYGDTFYQLIVLITTSNFPDIMLQAYYTSTWYTIYFVIFVIFGVFFLMNVLLAVIFDNYKKQVQLTSQNRGRERMIFIEKFYARYDEGAKGWLELHEAKAFFAYVLDLQYSERQDRVKFRSIMKVADPDDAKIILRHRVLEFFRLGGFLHLQELDEEQRRISGESEDEDEYDDEDWDIDDELYQKKKPLPRFGGSQDEDEEERKREPRFSYRNSGEIQENSMQQSLNSSGGLFTEQSSRFIQQSSEWRLLWVSILQSAWFRITIISFNILSISQFISLLYLMNSKLFLEYSRQWIIFALVINSIFLIDLVLHVAVFGFRRIMKKTEYVAELVLQVAMVIITILYLSVEYHAQVKITRYISITLLLRNLRLLSLLWELQDFRKISETFQRFSMPFLTCMFSLYTVMFFYAVIGEFFYAGEITILSVQ